MDAPTRPPSASIKRPSSGLWLSERVTSPAPVITHSYLFIEDVLRQANDPPGFPETWGFDLDTPVIADYEMDARIVDQPQYRHAFTEALQILPSISIVTDIQNFEALYANPRERGIEWERPASGGTD